MLALPPAAELQAVVSDLVRQQAATKGPDARKHKAVFQQLLVGWWRTTWHLFGQDTLQNLRLRELAGGLIERDTCRFEKGEQRAPAFRA